MFTITSFRFMEIYRSTILNNSDDDMLLQNDWTKNGAKPYFKPGPLSEISPP